MWEKRTLLHCFSQCFWNSHYESQHRELRQLKIDLLYDPAIPILEIHPKKGKFANERKQHVTKNNGTIRNSEEMETTQIFTEREMDKETEVHLYEILYSC